MKKARSHRTVSDAELLTVTRHLAAMLGAGIPIITALTISAERCSNKILSNTLLATRDRVNDGSTISSSLAAHPLIFGPIYRAMVEAGETAGILEENLHTLARDLAARIALRRHLIGAALYPAIVVLTLVVITSLLLLWVVPTFEELFADSGATLPWLTQIVVSLSHALSMYGPPLLAFGAFIVVSGARTTRRSDRLREKLSRVTLKIPFVALIQALSCSVRLSSTLGALIQSGIPIMEALATTSSVVGNAAVTRDLNRARSEILNGSSLSDALRESSAIHPTLVDYIAVGERSGRLEVMLLKCNEQLEQDLRDLVTRLQQMVEPALLLSIGAIVGTLVLAMYLPIFQIGDLINQ